MIRMERKRRLRRWRRWLFVSLVVSAATLLYWIPVAVNACRQCDQ